MVKKHNDNEDEIQEEIQMTDDHTDTTDPELSDMEDAEENKLKTLRTKLKEADDKYRDVLEELQRNRADFLNAKRRLKEERVRDKDRTVIAHVEKLLPIYDSFFLAQLDKDTWEKADEKWRQGIEGIFSQLKNVFQSYNVEVFDPSGQLFDATKHDALAMVPVTDTALDHQILSVIQLGAELKRGDTTELIRPARVTVGELG